MHVVVVATSPLLRPAVEQLRGDGHEVVVLDEPAEAARRVGPHGLTAVVAVEGDEAVAAVAALPARLRRRALLVQVADGVHTGDGWAAFRRGVNLVVVRGDVARLGELLPRAERRHRELVALLEPELAP